jgi:hypothetical protein
MSYFFMSIDKDELATQTYLKGVKICAHIYGNVNPVPRVKIYSIALVLLWYCIAILKPWYCIALKKLVLFILN